MKSAKRAPSASDKYLPGSFIGKLRKRRIIETLAAFIGGGWLIFEFVHWIIIDHYHIVDLGWETLRSDDRFALLLKKDEFATKRAKSIAHCEKFLSLWKDADPGIAEVTTNYKKNEILNSCLDFICLYQLFNVQR